MRRGGVADLEQRNSQRAARAVALQLAYEKGAVVAPAEEHVAVGIVGEACEAAVARVGGREEGKEGGSKT